MKEQSVLDIFMIARVCHYDTEDEEQGVKKLWSEDTSSSRYSLLAMRANKITEQIVLFKQHIFILQQSLEHVLKLKLILRYAQVSYSLHSVFTVSNLE